MSRRTLLLVWLIALSETGESVAERGPGATVGCSPLPLCGSCWLNGYITQRQHSQPGWSLSIWLGLNHVGFLVLLSVWAISCQMPGLVADMALSLIHLELRAAALLSRVSRLVAVGTLGIPCAPRW